MNKADLSLLLMTVEELVSTFRPVPILGTCDEMDHAIEFGIKCVASACRLLLFGRPKTRAFKQCKLLLETMIIDEVENYFFGRESSLKSHSEIAIKELVQETFTVFIEPMYTSKYTIPRKTALPLVNLDYIVPVRRAKTHKHVTIIT
jgi:hypothetical protein